MHAGEDYGPESIFQAITDCHADRIGHGTWLFSTKHIRDRSITVRMTAIETLGGDDEEGEGEAAEGGEGGDE